MNIIEMQIRDVLLGAGYSNIRVDTVLAPAWTTDWLAEGGRKKLKALGIAPPVGSAKGRGALFADNPVIRCPRCGSEDTRELSPFGSTACKALHLCTSCKEPFDYFKCI